MEEKNIIKEMEGVFICYDGRYWLVEQHDKDLYDGAFFAVPIYFNQDKKAEVRHGASNWCYGCNGAFLKNPEKNVIIEAYESQIKHLEWCKEIQKESIFDKKEDYQICLLKVNTKLDHYKKLLKGVA